MHKPSVSLAEFVRLSVGFLYILGLYAYLDFTKVALIFISVCTSLYIVCVHA